MSLRFRVGPWIYRLRIPPGPLVEEGQRLMGLTLFDAYEICLSPEVPAEHRFTVLVHELRHAWTRHFPPAQNEEEEADLTAAIVKQLLDDLDEQGGRARLERIKPEDELEALIEPAPAEKAPSTDDEQRRVPLGYVSEVDSAARSNGDRAQCGVCGLTVAGGSIVTAPPRWSRADGGLVAGRTLYCPHCNHLQDWLEGADTAGHPNGSVVSGPYYRRGGEVDNFLCQHPQAAGMLVE